MMLIVFGASYLVYNLQAFVSNPLRGFKETNEENEDYLIAKLTRELNLDVPPPLRFFIWFRGVIAALWGQFNLGETQSKTSVIDEIATAIPTTFRLVITATILAVVLGITVGVLTAIRQYSKFDYAMTFVSFLLFSLPVFWVAVLLKEYLAIGFNDFLVDPKVSPPWLVGLSIAFALVFSGFVGGSRKRFFMSMLLAFVGSAGLVFLLSETGWFANPGLGLVGVVLGSAALGLVFTHLVSSLGNRVALISALIPVALVTAFYFPIQSLLSDDSNLLTALLVGVGLGAISSVSAVLLSKVDRRVHLRIAAFTSFVATLLIILDRFMREFGEYAISDAVRGRPVPTVSESKVQLLDETQLSNFWVVGLDAIMHLILPTLALTLISFAGYVRFSRGSLLEVLNLDFIRTARAKGLPERTIIVRHALRNAMLPLTTILVNDFAGVIGGAIITESVFGWKGMGSLFNGAIQSADLNLFMGVFLLSASLTVFANFVADLLFGVVDPRIRVRK
jgi:peptide/nickel transport system permease protein